MSKSSVSSRVASEMLSVHESSIKRWCNAGELSFWLTPGGHRRIPVSKLVEFASGRDIGGSIVKLGTNAERVWIGLEAARNDGEYAILANLAHEYISLGRTRQLEVLSLYLIDEGIPISTVCDRVIRAAMVHVGIRYLAGEVSVGQEHRMTHSVRDALIGIGSTLSARGKQNLNGKTAVVGCLRGEIHELGALMIRLILSQRGWDVVYLGQNVPTEEFSALAREINSGLICVSLAPPFGNGEARDVVRLINELSTEESQIRLAVGGSGLESPPPREQTPNLAEVVFFQNAEPFEAWVTTRSPVS